MIILWNFTDHLTIESTNFTKGHELSAELSFLEATSWQKKSGSTGDSKPGLAGIHRNIPRQRGFYCPMTSRMRRWEDLRENLQQHIRLLADEAAVDGASRAQWLAYPGESYGKSMVKHMKTMT